MTKNRTAVVALIIGLMAGAAGGFALGTRNRERDLAGVAFINAVSRIGTATTTLGLIEQQQVAKAANLNEMMFRSSVADAAGHAEDVPPISQPSPNLRRSLEEAEAYATRHNWTEEAARLRRIQQAWTEAP